MMRWCLHTSGSMGKSAICASSLCRGSRCCCASANLGSCAPSVRALMCFCAVWVPTRRHLSCWGLMGRCVRLLWAMSCHTGVVQIGRSHDQPKCEFCARGTSRRGGLLVWGMGRTSWSRGGLANSTAAPTGAAATSPLTRIEVAGGLGGCVCREGCVSPCQVPHPLVAVGPPRQGGGLLTHPSRWSATALAGCKLWAALLQPCHAMHVSSGLATANYGSALHVASIVAIACVWVHLGVAAWVWCA